MVKPTTAMRGHCRNGHTFAIATLTDTCPTCGDIAFKVSAMMSLYGATPRAGDLTKSDDASTFTVTTVDDDAEA